MKLSTFPHLVKEWHPTKNGELTPEDFTHATKKKVWWLCSEGHSFETEVRNRVRRRMGCPICPKHYADESNNLATLFPEISKEWHPTKNKDLTPKQVAAKSLNNVWWLCPKGHSYKAKITNRTRWGNSKCPYCLGRRVGEDNNLLVVAPEVAKEWHPTENGELLPEQFTKSAKKKVWWLCSKGHSYKAKIASRTKENSTGCPKCTNQTSQPEVRILAELEWFFNEVILHHKIDNVEVDIFIPEVKIGIEYDGKYWHKGLDDIDLKKNHFLADKSIHLIRVRQEPLGKLTDKDILVGYQINKNNLNAILDRIIPYVGSVTRNKIATYQNTQSFVNEELFKEYRSYFPAPILAKSLLKTHPELASEWDYEKNNPLKPEDITYGSKKLVWWLCQKGHSYESRPNSRTASNHGCPYCSGRRTLNYDLFN